MLRTATLMGNAAAGFLNVKGGVKALRESSFYTPDMETSNKVIFFPEQPVKQLKLFPPV